MHNVLRTALLQTHSYKWRLSNNKMISVQCVRIILFLPMQASVSGSKYDLKTHQGLLGCIAQTPQRIVATFVRVALAHECVFEETIS